MNRSARSLSLVTLAAVAAAACDDPSRGVRPGSSSGLAIEQRDLRLQVGSSATLKAVNGAGEDVSAQAEWTTRDARTIELGRAGRATALAHGITWVVAEHAGARDSVRVTVPFGSSLAEGVALALGGGRAPITVSGVSRVVEYLGIGKLTTVVTAAAGPLVPAMLEDPGFFDADTLIRVVFDGVPEAGKHTLQPYELVKREDGTFSVRGGSGATVWVRDPHDPRRAEMWLPVGPVEVEIDETSVPQARGPATGALKGRLTFEGAGFQVALEDGPARIVGQVDTHTSPIYAEFNLVQMVWPIGSSTFSVEGGPYPLDEVVVWSPVASLKDGGVVIDLAKADRQRGVVYGTQLWTGAAGTGDFPLASPAPEALADGSAYTAGTAWGWSDIGTVAHRNDHGGPESGGISSGGTIRITGYTPPGEDVFGLISGTVSMEQEYLTVSGETGSQRIAMKFELPVLPRSESRHHRRYPLVEVPAPDPSRAALGSGSGVLYGRALEDGHIPVPEVRVTLSGPGGTATVTSDAEGYFTFSSLEGGMYSLRFDIPAGYDLARGQQQVMDRVNLPVGGDSQMFLKFSDAAGNGALRVVAFDPAASQRLDGVRIRIRRQGSTGVLSTLVTGERPHEGAASTKLQPGSYELEIVPPAGYGFPDGTTDRRVVEVHKGHTSTHPIPLVRR